MTGTIALGDASIARIGLGTNRLANTAENVAFVREAVDAGVGMIDTAHGYAGGESEATIGAASPPEGFLVATKGGYGDGRPAAIRAQIEESLRRLRTDCIELYYLHKPDPDVPIEESLEPIAEQRERGSIRHVGLSNVSVEQVERARRVVPVAAVQNHYNLTERGCDDVLDHCAENGIVFVPYFPLRSIPAAAEEIAERRGATPAQVALAWLLARSPATLPIPGSLSIEHVRENLAAAEIELGGEDLDALS